MVDILGQPGELVPDPSVWLCCTVICTVSWRP